MIDYGIYEIQKDKDGLFHLTEKLSGETQLFSDLIAMIIHIESQLREVENSEVEEGID